MAHHSHGETSLTDLLLDYLEELTEDELKKFKFNLIHMVNEKYQRIPRGQLEKMGRTDLADKMISFYCEADALKVTLTTLSKMSLNDLAQRLDKELKTALQGRNEKDNIPQKTHPPVVPNQAAVVFIDQHRKAIIQRVTLIDPILDDLYKHIEGEKYNNIRAASTSQERMRRLYELLNTDRLKELFYDALKKNESYLVEELLAL